MNYGSSFVNLPVVVNGETGELIIPASKVQGIKGTNKGSVITYKDGDTTERITSSLAPAAIWDLVLPKMAEWE